MNQHRAAEYAASGGGWRGFQMAIKRCGSGHLRCAIFNRMCAGCGANMEEQILALMPQYMRIVRLYTQRQVLLLVRTHC